MDEIDLSRMPRLLNLEFNIKY
jgi:hypothetical protein